MGAVADALQPYRQRNLQVVSQYDPNSKRATAILRLPVIDLMPSIIIGDFLHNTRSALDHLVWQLVIANGQIPSNSNMFPICNDSLSFAHQISRGRLNGIPLQAHARIEALQPYQRGKPLCDMHPLWILSELTNIDKHRSVNLTTVLADTVDFDGWGVHVNIVCGGLSDRKSVV